MDPAGEGGHLGFLASLFRRLLNPNDLKELELDIRKHIPRGTAVRTTRKFIKMCGPIMMARWLQVGTVTSYGVRFDGRGKLFAAVAQRLRPVKTSGASGWLFSSAYPTNRVSPPRRSARSQTPSWLDTFTDNGHRICFS